MQRHESGSIVQGNCRGGGVSCCSWFSDLRLFTTWTPVLKGWPHHLSFYLLVLYLIYDLLSKIFADLVLWSSPITKASITFHITFMQVVFCSNSRPNNVKPGQTDIIGEGIWTEVKVYDIHRWQAKLYISKMVLIYLFVLHRLNPSVQYKLSTVSCLRISVLFIKIVHICMKELQKVTLKMGPALSSNSTPLSFTSTHVWGGGGVKRKEKKCRYFFVSNLVLECLADPP